MNELNNSAFQPTSKDDNFLLMMMLMLLMNNQSGSLFGESQKSLNDNNMFLYFIVFMILFN